MVDTTVEIANKVSGAEIVSRIVEDLKDDNEPFRKMVMDCLEKVNYITVHLDIFTSSIITVICIHYFILSYGIIHSTCDDKFITSDACTYIILEWL